MRSKNSQKTVTWLSLYVVVADFPYFPLIIVRKASLELVKKIFQKGLLSVQAILGFFPNYGVRCIENCCADFFATVGWKAVHK